MSRHNVALSYQTECGTEAVYEVTADVSPAEPMVRYYADGSGYPGAPAECEVTQVRVLSIGDTARRGHEDWFKLADEIVAAWVDAHHSDVEDEVFEALGQD